MSWGEFPEITLVCQPIGIRTQQTVIYEQAIRAHIKSCVSSVNKNSDSNLVTVDKES